MSQVVKCGRGHERVRGKPCKGCDRIYYQKLTKDDVRRNNRLNNLRGYGINHETFDTLRFVQGNLCAICRGPMSEHNPLKGDSVVIDHFEGPWGEIVIRGLIHMRCNTGLGMFGHDPDALRAAADYIERGNLVAWGTRAV